MPVEAIINKGSLNKYNRLTTARDIIYVLNDGLYIRDSKKGWIKASTSQSQSTTTLTGLTDTTITSLAANDYLRYSGSSWVNIILEDVQSQLNYWILDGSDIYFNTGSVRIDGDLFFETDGSGLPYGAMSQENVPTTVTINVAGTAEIIDGMTGGETNLATFQNSQELKVTKAGRYFISWAVSFNMASGAGQEVEGAIGKGGTAQPEGSAHRTIGSGNDTGSMCGTAILDLAANDLITIMVTNEASTINVIVAHASLILTMVGGT